MSLLFNSFWSGLNDPVSSIVIPKYLYCATTGMPLMDYICFHLVRLSCLMIMMADLSRFISMSDSLLHYLAISIALKSSLSPLDMKAKSSAKAKVCMLFSANFLRRPLMYKLKSVGDNTAPYGTPVVVCITSSRRVPVVSDSRSWIMTIS